MADKKLLSGYKEIRVKVSKLLYSRLNSCARRRGSTMSDIVRNATILFINEYDKNNKSL